MKGLKKIIGILMMGVAIGVILGALVLTPKSFTTFVQPVEILFSDSFGGESDVWFKCSAAGRITLVMDDAGNELEWYPDDEIPNIIWVKLNEDITEPTTFYLYWEES